MSQPKYNVKFLRAAEEDFTEIVTYIAADRPPAAETLATKIEKNLQLLVQNPRLGRVPMEEDIARHYRYLVVENCLIFYAIEGQTIFVHRILHGARDYQGLF